MVGLKKHLPKILTIILAINLAATVSIILYLHYNQGEFITLAYSLNVAEKRMGDIEYNISALESRLGSYDTVIVRLVSNLKKVEDKYNDLSDALNAANLASSLETTRRSTPFPGPRLAINSAELNSINSKVKQINSRLYALETRVSDIEINKSLR